MLNVKLPTFFSYQLDPSELQTQVNDEDGDNGAGDGDGSDDDDDGVSPNILLCLTCLHFNFYYVGWNR